MLTRQHEYESLRKGKPDAWVVGGPGPGRAELERYRLVIGAHPHTVGYPPEWALKSVAASSASDAWAVGEQSSGKIHDSLHGVPAADVAAVVRRVLESRHPPGGFRSARRASKRACWPSGCCHSGSSRPRRRAAWDPGDCTVSCPAGQWPPGQASEVSAVFG
jgi:hypothetical protein